MGFTLTLSLPPDHHGNVGPLDVALAFKPPNGVGLSLDAGVVIGGGYPLHRHRTAANTPARCSSMFADFLTVTPSA